MKDTINQVSVADTRSSLATVCATRRKPQHNDLGIFYNVNGRCCVTRRVNLLS